jgi:hypothetical protein
MRFLIVRLFFAVVSIVVVGVAVAGIGCSSSVGSACSSAGGTCVLGPANCAQRGPDNAQDCETNPPNPGGAFCCLELGEGGLPPADGGGLDDGQALPACSWPSALDPVDGASTQCVAGRTYLSCKAPNGDSEGCLSDDPTQCPGPDPVVGQTFSACVDQCDAGEYAVVCGGVGPGPSTPLPDGCRMLPPNPGGAVMGCCPCNAPVADGGAGG